MSATGKIHAPKERKPGGRVDRFLSFLEGRGHRGATTAEIISGARVMAVSSIAAEARAMGYSVTCEAQGMSEDGARVYRYWVSSWR